MTLNNRQIRPYLEERELKFYELELLDIIKREKPGFSGRMADIGCASGNFLRALRQTFPTSHLTGLELNDELIAIARERLANKAEIIKADVSQYVVSEPFEVAIASGVLSIFEDPLPILDTWISWMAPGGLLLLYAKFNTKNIDTRILFRSHHNPHGWEEGLTSFFIGTISEHLARHDVAFEFKRFELPIELPESDDPVRNYTVVVESGEKMLINGANIITEPYFLIIRRKG